MKRLLIGMAGAASVVAMLAAGGHRVRSESFERSADYIVEATDLEIAAAAVEAAGGEVTHRLAIIDAVGARLTPSQLRRLTTADGIVRATSDRPVEVASGDILTVRDEFSARTFSGNDGSRSWRDDWTEIGEADGAKKGWVKIERSKGKSSLCGGDCLVLAADRGVGVGIAREANLEGATDGTLTFTYAADGDGGEVALEVSADGGGSWTRLDSFALTAAVSGRQKSYDLTPYASASTQIRFVVTAAGRGKMGLDDLQIAYTAAASSAPRWTVSDEFNGVTFSGEDGSLRWAGPWVEIGEDDGPKKRDVRVTKIPSSGRLALRVAKGDKGARRAVNLSHATDAILSFRYWQEKLDKPERYVTVQISGDGGATWTELARISGSSEHDSGVQASYDVASYASAKTVLRFVASPTVASGKLYVDDVQFGGSYQSLAGSQIDAYEPAPAYSGFPTLVEASRLHDEGTTGAGVTVAAVDTGLWTWPGLSRSSQGSGRTIVRYDAIRDQLVTAAGGQDLNGHGTHIGSVILDSAAPANSPWTFNGVAPDAGLVAVKAFDDNGKGSYLTIIRGLDWILTNSDTYQIRVVNLSFSAEPQSHYWDDPLNRAVMALWQAGIVVVVSAGNDGPDPMTVGVPANVPYVITVGAMSDAATPEVPDDDYLASFSAAGPTFEGFVKPDLVAPGGHMLGVVSPASRLATQHPKWLLGTHHLYVSGTSQAAAVVTGTVALMLQREPRLTPDEVKCRLMASARPAVDVVGNLAYSVFQQGAGMVHAYDAVYNLESACANRGLDVAADLAGLLHFGGRANQRSDQTFYLMAGSEDGTQGFTWDGSYSWSEAYLWSDAYPWVDAYLWSDAFPWVDAYLWSDAYPWVDAFTWTDDLTESMSINAWVPQE